MEISGEYTFEAPQDLVWNALQNPMVLGSVVHACLGVQRIRDNMFEGTLRFKAGSLEGSFKGFIELFDMVEPQSYRIEVNGKGVLGIVRVKGGMNLTPNDDTTIMHYTGDAQFGGRIASVGQRLLDVSVRTMIDQSLDSLNKYLITQKR